MTQYNIGIKGYAAGEDLIVNRRVKLSSGTVVYADAGEEAIGTVQKATDSGSIAPVALDSAAGSVEVTASGSITEQCDLYAANDGKMSATISGRRQGIALEAASDGADFEMMPAGVDS